MTLPLGRHSLSSSPRLGRSQPWGCRRHAAMIRWGCFRMLQHACMSQVGLDRTCSHWMIHKRAPIFPVNNGSAFEIFLWHSWSESSANQLRRFLFSSMASWIRYCFKISTVVLSVSRLWKGEQQRRLSTVVECSFTVYLLRILCHVYGRHVNGPQINRVLWSMCSFFFQLSCRLKSCKAKLHSAMESSFQAVADSLILSKLS